MKYIAILFLSILCIQCTEKEEKFNDEQFESINFGEIQNQLDASAEKFTPEDVMVLYSGTLNHSNEGQISKHQLKNDTFQVVLIYEKLEDDSVEAEKYVMKIKKQDGKWNILDLKKNWRCWENRGHTTWGIELCN